MQALAQIVLEYIRKHDLLCAGDRVGVAVSGGADSVALLRLLVELRREIGLVLSVVHFNHKLRGEESEGDQRFVAELAQTHKLEFHCESGDVKRRAGEEHLSLETAARAMRYEYFRQLLRDGVVNRIATGHTLDDQAETVLLRVVRGAGTRGLAGIYPKLVVARDSSRESGVRSQGSGSSPAMACAIVRPLLGVRRSDLESFLKEINQSWREDSSNRDLRHARNRVRHGILPRLERHLNPAAREALAETAEIARAEEVFWNWKMSQLLPQFWRRLPADTARGVAGELSCHLPGHLAVQRRIVLAAAESLGLNLEFKHVEQVLELARFNAPPNGAAALPKGWTVRREKDVVRFVPPSTVAGPANYEHALTVPGSVDVPEIRSRFEAVIVSRKRGTHESQEGWLNPEVAAAGLVVRNWRAGDRFWPAHTREPKKIKELLAEKHVTGRERQLWPVVVHGAELVWVRGFPTPQRLQPAKGAETAVLVRERPLSSKRESG